MTLLAGKKMIVVAGVTGTGKATALVAAREGASVVTMSRADAAADRVIRTHEELRAAGVPSSIHIQCDASSKESVDAAFAKGVEFLGGLDAAVFAQGTFEPAAAADISAETVAADFGSSFYGSLFGAQAALPHLKANGGGSIIMFGALAFTDGNPFYLAYNAAKGAVVGLSRTLAKEWGEFNIRVNMVAPVLFTELSEKYLEVATPEQIAVSEETLKAIVLGGSELKGFARMGNASECGELNAFLCSDRAKFITGQYINVDGGAALSRL